MEGVSVVCCETAAGCCRVVKTRNTPCVYALFPAFGGWLHIESEVHSLCITRTGTVLCVVLWGVWCAPHAVCCVVWCGPLVQQSQQLQSSCSHGLWLLRMLVRVLEESHTLPVSGMQWVGAWSLTPSACVGLVVCVALPSSSREDPSACVCLCVRVKPSACCGCSPPWTVARLSGAASSSWCAPSRVAFDSLALKCRRFLLLARAGTSCAT